MRNILNKFLFIVFGIIISLFGVKCSTNEATPTYGAPLAPYAALLGKVIEKSSNPQKSINEIRVYWSNQVNSPMALTESDGSFLIRSEYSNNIPSLNYILEAKDIDGISNGGLYLTFSTSGTFEVSSDKYGENYVAKNILIEMSKSN